MGRLPYIYEESTTAETREALEAVRHRRGSVSTFSRSLAHSVGALNAFERFSAHVNGISSLDHRTRELLILRVAQLRANEFEWRRHVPKALAAGVTLDEIEALKGQDTPSQFDRRECAVLELADRHIRDGETDAVTIDALRIGYGDELVIEILFVLGWYQFVSALILPLDLIADDPEPPDLAVPFAHRRAG